MAVRAVKLYEGFTFKSEYTILDFFTFSCINCTNNIEKLKRLLYDEVEIIGIHTPKFTFEKEEENLEDAIKELQISYKVIQDREHKLAREYAIKAWPTLVLVDKRGYIVDTYVGEKDIDKLALFLDEKFQKKQLPSTQEKFYNKIYAFYEGEAKRVVVTHSNGLTIYDSDANLLEEYSLGPCFGVRSYSKQLYTICNNNVIKLCKHNIIQLCDNGKVSFKNLLDLEFMQDELYISDAGTHQIIVLDTQTFQEKRRFGNRFEALRDGRLEEAQLAQPSALASLYDELYFVDAESSSLRYIQADEVKTLIGEGLFEFGDSNEEPILLQHPTDLCIGEYGDGCGGGRIFIADTFNKKVKVYERESDTIMTLIELDASPYSITKLGCNLYIAMKKKIMKFDISMMKSELFIEER